MRKGERKESDWEGDKEVRRKMMYIHGEGERQDKTGE